MTRGQTANGGTSIGCGLTYCLDAKIAVDGIAIVSDGCENIAPSFASEYSRYTKRLDAEPTVYWYRVKTGYPAAAVWNYGLAAVQQQANYELQLFRKNCQTAKIDLQEFDLTGGADFYSLPNLAQTMRVGRYQLLDEILSYRLRTLDEVLDKTRGFPVLPRQLVTV
jgi:hypothetical protein